MNGIFFFILLLLNTNIKGQQNERLMVSLTKNATAEDSFCIYNMSIKNKSDSIVCVLHSIFMDLTSDIPQGFALYTKSKTKEQYTFHYSFMDTVFDMEVLPYKGECILPHQTLKFQFKIEARNNEVSKYLNFEYFYLKDIAYRDFINSMNKVGTWYQKYNRLEKSIKM